MGFSLSVPGPRLSQPLPLVHLVCRGAKLLRHCLTQPQAAVTAELELADPSRGTAQPWEPVRTGGLGKPRQHLPLLPTLPALNSAPASVPTPPVLTLLPTSSAFTPFPLPTWPCIHSPPISISLMCLLCSHYGCSYTSPLLPWPHLCSLCHQPPPASPGAAAQRSDLHRPP